MRVEIAQLVYASSDAVYSLRRTSISEATPRGPDLTSTASCTGRSELDAGGRGAGTAWRSCVCTAIYGAGDTHNFVRAEPLPAPGAQGRPHCAVRQLARRPATISHVDDAVDLISRGHLAWINGSASTSPAEDRRRSARLPQMIAARAGRPVEIAAVGATESRRPIAISTSPISCAPFRARASGRFDDGIGR